MPYHKYVFDLKNKKFIGKFNEMYQREDVEDFDSWFSSDLTHLPKLISLAILNRYNFKNILDFGCGKGSFTHILKKRNNYVLGLDISKTAIKKAKVNYGNKIDFMVIQDNEFTSFVQKQKFDLTIILETLSYIENWRKAIKDISKFSIYIYITLYIPANPIGFVKSFQELIDAIENYFNIEEKIIYNDESIFILAKNLNKEVQNAGF